MKRILCLIILASCFGCARAQVPIPAAEEKPLDTVTVLQIQIALKDIEIAEKSKALANAEAQRIFQGFMIKHGLKGDEWTLDEKRMVLRKAKPAPATPDAKEKP